MKQLLNTLILAVIIVVALVLPELATAQSSPGLQKNGNAAQLMIDGKPYIVLGGELHNSSSSNLEYLQPSWEQQKAMNLNTVLAAVSWQLT